MLKRRQLSPLPLLSRCFVLLLAVWGIATSPLAAQDLDDELLRSLETPLDKAAAEALDKKSGQNEKKDADEPAEKSLGKMSSDEGKQDGNAAKPEELAPLHQEPLPGAILDLDEGLVAAQQAGKPVLVVVTGEDCPWCYRLKHEMQQSPAKEEVARWTLVEIDIDNDPAASKRLGVAVLPSLRLLRSSGAKVASQDGYLSSAKLADWLKEHRRSAVASADDVLVAERTLEAADVVRLVGHLKDRDPLVREAAISRLQASPQLAAVPLIAMFREGKLAERLSILEILTSWHAPLEGIDPWQPESIDQVALARLEAWATELKENGEGIAQELSAEELAEANLQIDRLLTLSPADGAPIAARLARHAEKLLPEVYRRLEEAETDDQRERLLALRYRLVAQDALVLRFPGGLARLASRDVQTRREAAEQLAGLASANEQPLLLELFSDPDPLIREIALRGLQQSGGEEAMKSLVRLLKDPEPNVRAAVLKQLTEQQTDTLVAEVADYIQQEQDADLLVHAIRYLREVKNEPSARALLPLLEHEAWQVRAEAAEGLREMLGGELSENPELTADIYAGLIQRLDDDDAFVVSRAIEAFSRKVSDVAIEKLFVTVEKHPQLAALAIKTLAQRSEGSTKVTAKLQDFAKNPNPSIRAAAVDGLRYVTLETLDQWGPPALQDDDASVRQIAATAVFTSLETKRHAVVDQMNQSTRMTETYPARPRAPSLLSQALGSLFGSKSKKKDEASPVSEDENEAKGEEAADDKGKAETEGEDALPVSDRWDRWLADFKSGKGRASYYDDLIDPLMKMLEADDPKERLLAALNLVPLGHSDEALPVLQAIVAEDPQHLQKASAILPWVPWEQRKELFESFLTLATNNEQKIFLARAVSDAVDRRASRLLWPLLKDEAADVSFASGIADSLVTAYTGQRYWYGDEVPQDVKAWVLADAPARAKEGTELESLVALIVLSKLDQQKAVELANEISEDSQRPEQLQRDAFQMALLLAPAEKQTELAAAALTSSDPDRQKLGITVLVSEDAFELRSIRNQFYISRTSSRFYSNSDGGPIIPTPPEGISEENVAPLLSHDDAKVRAYAGYAMAMLDKKEGLPALLDYWRDHKNDENDEMDRLVFRAIAKLNDSNHVDILRQIYDRLEDYQKSEFYWTIRIMSGEEALRLRKEIRDNYGIENLR
ncbi:HEAT repeat domain-containing protein [Blastopirellula marina]|nr:HEAT repeat domain-containing protein [Blastopirellula marina]